MTRIEITWNYLPECIETFGFVNGLRVAREIADEVVDGVDRTCREHGSTGTAKRCRSCGRFAGLGYDA